MRYCATCGHGNEDGSLFCYSCGQRTPVATPAYNSPVPASPVPTPESIQPGDSRMALAGFSLGAVGLLLAIPATVDESIVYAFPIVCILIGLPLSIISLNQDRNLNRTNTTAITGIAFGVIATWMLIVAVPLSVLLASPLDQKTIIGDDYFVVGKDVAAGDYGSAGAVDPAKGLCEFTRLSSSDEVVYSGEAGAHRVVVTIQSSDGAFVTRNCGHWYPLRVLD